MEAGDCPVPACRADPLGGVAALPRAVIGGRIVAGRVPYRRAAGIEEAKPHRHVIGVCAARMENGSGSGWGRVGREGAIAVVAVTITKKEHTAGKEVRRAVYSI